MSQLFRLPAAAGHDPAIDLWLHRPSTDLASIATTWFRRLRSCGADVRELFHDGCPTVCVQDAAFAYVAVFKSHVNLGFFHGTSLPDPKGLLEGSGKSMRHVKLRPGQPVDAAALQALIEAAHQDILARLNEAR